LDENAYKKKKKHQHFFFFFLLPQRKKVFQKHFLFVGVGQ
jgi:hypothetical protein